MKKLITILLLFALIFTIAACGGDNETSSSSIDEAILSSTSDESSEKEEPKSEEESSIVSETSRTISYSNKNLGTSTVAMTDNMPGVVEESYPSQEERIKELVDFAIEHGKSKGLIYDKNIEKTDMRFAAGTTLEELKIDYVRIFEYNTKDSQFKYFTVKFLDLTEKQIEQNLPYRYGLEIHFHETNTPSSDASTDTE
jgi:hypothetical protein